MHGIRTAPRHRGNHNKDPSPGSSPTQSPVSACGGRNKAAHKFSTKTTRAAPSRPAHQAAATHSHSSKEQKQDQNNENQPKEKTKTHRNIMNLFISEDTRKWQRKSLQATNKSAQIDVFYIINSNYGELPDLITFAE